MSFGRAQRMATRLNGSSPSSNTARNFFGLFYEWTQYSYCQQHLTRSRCYSTAPESATHSPRDPAPDSTAAESIPDSAPEPTQESGTESYRNKFNIREIRTDTSIEGRYTLDRMRAKKATRHAEKQRRASGLPGSTLPDTSNVPLPAWSEGFSKPSLLPAKTHSSTLNPDKMRHLMRSMPHSVVVITTNTSAPEERHDWVPESNWKGMTLSSFTTLTLSPVPIVTFNIKRPSQTLDAIKEGRHFLVHILENNQRGAEIADTFSRGSYGSEAGTAHNPFENLRTSSELEHLAVEKVRYISSPITKERLNYALPCIKDTGVRAVLYCSLLSSHSGGLIAVGDHTVCFAGVNQILPTGREASHRREGKLIKARRKGDTVDGFGLMYADGKFRQVGMRLNIDRAKHDQSKLLNRDVTELSEILEAQELGGGRDGDVVGEENDSATDDGALGDHLEEDTVANGVETPAVTAGKTVRPSDNTEEDPSLSPGENAAASSR